MTQKDIAKHFGISQVTVSYALNKPDSRKCSQALRKKILDYCAKHAPEQLHSRKSFQIAVMIAERKKQRTFYHPALDGIKAKAKEADYQVLITEPGELNKLYQEKNFDGLITIAPLEDYTIFTKDLPEEMPKILFNDHLPELEINSVMPDYLSSSYQVIKHLYDTGHRKISSIFISRRGGMATNPHLFEPENTFRYYLERFGLSTKYCRHIKIPFILSPELFPYFNETIDTFLQNGDFPDAFFIGDQYIPYWSRCLNKKGFSIPDDVSIVGFDNKGNSLNGLGITSVDFNLKTAGEKAFQLLYSEICTGVRNNFKIDIKPKLILRETVRRRDL